MRTFFYKIKVQNEVQCCNPHNKQAKQNAENSAAGDEWNIDMKKTQYHRNYINDGDSACGSYNAPFETLSWTNPAGLIGSEHDQ